MTDERSLGPKQREFLRKFADRPFAREECTPSEKQWLNGFVFQRGLLELACRQAEGGVLYAVTDKARALIAEPAPEKREIVIDRIELPGGVIRFEVRDYRAFYALVNPAILHIALPEQRLLNWQDMEAIMALHRTAQRELKRLVEAQWAKEDAEKEQSESL